MPPPAGDGNFEQAISYIKSDLKREIWISGLQANLSTDLQSYSDEIVWTDDLYPAIARSARTQAAGPR